MSLSKTHRPRTIGVLGGMGPAATIEFFRRLVAATPAAIDQAHVRILIDNNPHIPDRTRALLNGGPDPSPALAAMAQGLETAGADFLTMPCNTGHAFKGVIMDAVSIPFIDMIEEAVDALTVGAVGLLATTGTVETKLYETVCARRGITLVTPDHDNQRLVMDIIARIKAGGSGESVRDHTAAVVETLASRGAEAVIAGCTEISLIPGDVMPIPWIDALDCLVSAAMQYALNPD